MQFYFFLLLNKFYFHFFFLNTILMKEILQLNNIYHPIDNKINKIPMRDVYT